MTAPVLIDGGDSTCSFEHRAEHLALNGTRGEESDVPDLASALPRWGPGILDLISADARVLPLPHAPRVTTGIVPRIAKRPLEGQGPLRGQTHCFRELHPTLTDLVGQSTPLPARILRGRTPPSPPVEGINIAKGR